MDAVRKSMTGEIESSITGLERLTVLIIWSLIVIATVHNIDFIEYFTDDSSEQAFEGYILHRFKVRDCLMLIHFH